MQYGALLGGKRLRPFLVYATGQMFGVSTATLDAPAAAVECIHAYSLIHDDLPAMDDDDLRRGLPTCHIKFGEANAILAGDALALERIHRHKTGALIRAAVRLGALSAGDKGRNTLPILDRYAESIGLAFQVQDDILDVVGDTATLGKRQGADQQLGKSTYPALLGLEQARNKARDLIEDARQSLHQLAAQSLDTSALEALANYIIQRDK